MLVVIKSHYVSVQRAEHREAHRGGDDHQHLPPRAQHRRQERQRVRPPEHVAVDLQVVLAGKRANQRSRTI